MRNLVIPAVALIVLAAGSAWAQGFSAQYDTSEYAGVGAGLPFGAFYGLSDALGPDVDVRFRVGVIPFPGLFAILIGADVLAEVADVGDQAGGVYIGAGAGATYANIVGTRGFGVEASAIVGVHLRFSEGVSGFLEGGPTLAYGFATEDFGAGLDVIPRSTLGVLFHF